MAALIVIYSFVLWPLRKSPIADRKSHTAKQALSVETSDLPSAISDKP
jgi:hypothetical protein